MNRQLEGFFRARHEEGKFNGCAIVAERGEPLLAESYGLANVDSGEALSLDHVFRVASVTKQFTCMAVMILKESGLLEYDDLLKSYLPEFPYPAVTIRHIMTLRSGLGFWSLCDEHLDRTKDNGNEDLLELVCQHKPEPFLAPGEKVVFTNMTFEFLALVIEKVSGASYADFVRERIFEPLGMTSTCSTAPSQEHAVVSKQAWGYVPAESGDLVLEHNVPANALLGCMGGFRGGMSIWSSAQDLLRWEQSLYTDQLVTFETLDECFTPTRNNDGSLAQTFFGSNYGFGWAIARIDCFTGPPGCSHPVHGIYHEHGGGIAGQQSHLFRLIDARLTIILLANVWNDDFYQIGGELMDLLAER